MASSGDYGQTQVPLVFVEPTQQPSRKPEPDRSGGLVISRGFLGVLVVLLLGAAIAGTGGFYWLWKGATTSQADVQQKLDAATKANKQLTDDKAALTTQLSTAQQALVPYGEIERLKGATAAERQKIADLLKVPSKVDYWKYHKPVDMSDPVIREPAEMALKLKLDMLQKLSNDIGVWTKPGGPAEAPPAGAIRPSEPGSIRPSSQPPG